MNKIREKKGAGQIKLILILIAAVLIFCGFLFLRMKWKKFKASANFGLYITLIVIAVILILFFVIRSKINTAIQVRRAEKEAKKEAIEQNRQIEQGQDVEGRDK